MILPYTKPAAILVDALIEHYLERSRPEAVISLFRVLEEASASISARTARVYDAPRPYPILKERGTYWTYFSPYWIAYRRPNDPVISAVFYDTANIPGRLRGGE